MNWRAWISSGEKNEREASSPLDSLTRKAALILVWERVWPALVTILSLIALFFAVSWAGFWLHAPLWLRLICLTVFAAGLGLLLFGLVRLSWPSRRESLARLDRDSGQAHRPATSFEDQLANDTPDAATRALWQVHLARTARHLSGLKLATPSPGMVERDRYALRAAALVALFATAFIAGPEKNQRLFAAFDWRSDAEKAQAFRLDAWIDPPAYTGRPPILLTGVEQAQGIVKVQAPAGSSVIVRASTGAGVKIEADGGLQAQKPEENTSGKITTRVAGPQSKTTSPENEQRFILRGDGKLVLKQYNSTLAHFDLISVPDRPPTIALRGEAKSDTKGALTLGYKIEDDYGVLSAEAQFSAPIIQGKPVTGRSLVEAPKMPLALPGAAGGLGEGETTGDLSEHPWAGARVTLRLSARDEGGNEGLSDPVEITLPQRTFVKPLARALVEQRRNLVLAPDDRKRVILSMDALLFMPERFDLPSNIYLGLRTIAQRLKLARKDADLLSVADLMWEMALRLEDGDLSQAERDLRAAQQQLREALERGATPEELKKLMDQLRAALDKFMQELAEQALRDQQNADRQADPNQQVLTITPRDLQALLDRMEQMMRNGETADAQRMLDSLQRMMENLQSAKRRNQQNEMAREMNRQMGELDKLTREQQQLRDQTYRDRQQQGEQEGQERDGKSEQQDLQRKQEALRERLEELQRRMKQFGQKGEDGFDEAEQAMRDAEKGLGEGSQQGRDQAVDAQGRALEGLRKGAQSMAQQMQQGEGQGQAGPGPGDPNGPMREGRNSPNPDPLGRESRDRSYNPQSRYDPQGVPAAERAQRVLEELRKRFSDPSRPREELDYLERLLRRY